MRNELVQGAIAEPFYHWTHDPVETFSGMLGNPAYRFIYLHRDPRDAAVSWAHDFQRGGKCGDMSFTQLLDMVVTHNQPPHVRAAVRWVKSDCMVITFRQVKKSIGQSVWAILDYVGYFDDADTTSLSDGEIEQIIEKYSCEAISGRKRGEPGDTIRSGYMLRKGISGEWRSQFSAELIRKCNAIMGREILALGYEIAGPANESNAQNLPTLTVSDSNASKTVLAQIVSPPFSCGVAWLINALLHLDVKVTNTGFNPGHWQKISDGWKLSNTALAHLKWHLPVLHERQQFKVPEPLEVFWEHRLDFAAVSHPTILFVRDPRDAVFSLYRRNYAKDISFGGYLNRPDEWPDHFPGLFQMPPLETYAYFCWFWLAMGEIMPVRLVRFEDVKASPVRVLREVLQYLGIERTDEQIRAAVASSDVEQARLAMEKMEVETGREFKTVRKAQVGEWRRTYSMLTLFYVRKVTKAIIQQLGYAKTSDATWHWLVSDDYRDWVRKKIPSPLVPTVTNWLLATEEGHAPKAAQISAEIMKLAVSGKDLLKLATITEAIYYTQKIFPDMAVQQARSALNLFVNLNLYFFDQWSVQMAAWYGLRRIEVDGGVPMLSRLGVYHGLRLKALNRIWELS